MEENNNKIRIDFSEVAKKNMREKETVNKSLDNYFHFIVRMDFPTTQILHFNSINCSRIK